MRSTFQLSFAAMLMLAMTGQPPTPTPMPPRQVTVQEVQLISVTDGDTYVFEIANQYTVRLANADTWESRRVRRAGSDGITDEELAKGKLAKERVEALLKSGRVFLETDPGKEAVKRDNFGRVLGKVSVFDTNGTRDAGEWLKINGHTRN